jgi:YVTN family beta-propeller protein
MRRLGFAGALACAIVLGVAGNAWAATSWVYVANEVSGTVTPIEVATNKPGAEIKVGSEPVAVAVPPDGKTVYVANGGSNTVTPIDVATNNPGSEIKVGVRPSAIAVTPDGRTAYVTNLESGTVTPIEVATNTTGPEIKVGPGPDAVAVTPDGKTAYVVNFTSGAVTPIEVATNKPGPEIKVGLDPNAVAVTPDGKTAYVTNGAVINGGVSTMTPIDVATDKPGPEITVGPEPFGVAVTPDGKTAYITLHASGAVMPIEVATNKPGAELKVGSGPIGIAVTRIYQTPIVTKVSATSGPVTGDKVVTLTGANLGLLEAVEFGGVPASQYFVAKSETEIGVLSPSREVAGTVDVTVRTPGGTSKTTTKDHYKYLPVITSVEPNSGSTAGGEQIIVFGAGFKPGENENTFVFGTTIAPASFCFSGPGENCIVVTPAHAAGKVDVRATVNGATSAKTKADQYTYK